MGFRWDERLEDPGFERDFGRCPVRRQEGKANTYPSSPIIGSTPVLPRLVLRIVASVGLRPAVSGQSSAGQSSHHRGAGARHSLTANTPAR